jgi:hypothetical protein
LPILNQNRVEVKRMGGVDSLPSPEDLPVLALSTALNSRHYDEEGVIDDINIIEEYIRRRLAEMRTNAEDLGAVQRIAFELINKTRLHATVYKILRSSS